MSSFSSLLGDDDNSKDRMSVMSDSNTCYKENINITATPIGSMTSCGVQQQKSRAGAREQIATRWAAYRMASEERRKKQQQQQQQQIQKQLLENRENGERGVVDEDADEAVLVRDSSMSRSDGNEKERNGTRAMNDKNVSDPTSQRQEKKQQAGINNKAGNMSLAKEERSSRVTDQERKMAGGVCHVCREIQNALGSVFLFGGGRSAGGTNFNSSRRISTVPVRPSQQHQQHQRSNDMSTSSIGSVITMNDGGSGRTPETDPSEHISRNNENIFSSTPTTAATATATSTTESTDCIPAPPSHTKKGKVSETSRTNLSKRLTTIHCAAAVKAEVETLSLRRHQLQQQRHTKQHQQRNHVNQQQNIQKEQTLEGNDSDNNRPQEEEEQQYDEELISILPAGYDLPLALSFASMTRHRAFLLLDLASIISAHCMFLNITSIGNIGVGVGVGVDDNVKAHTNNNNNNNRTRKHHVNTTKVSATTSSSRNKKKVHIQPQFVVTKNRDVELLKLLIRLNVGLRCNCGDDVVAVQKAIYEERRCSLFASMDRGEQEKEKEEEEEEVKNTAENNDNYLMRKDKEEEEETDLLDGDVLLVDDAGHTRKPDGYLRRLLFPSSSPGDEGFIRGRIATDKKKRCHTGDIAVDGPEEIKRILMTVRRFAERKAKLSSRRMRKDRTTGTVGIEPYSEMAEQLEPEDEQSFGNETVSFILRLPPLPDDSVEEFTSDDVSWEDLIRSCHALAREENSTVSGVSVDLSSWADSCCCEDATATRRAEEGKDGGKELPTEALPNEVLGRICTRLRRVCLLLMTLGREKVRVDMTGLPYPLTKERAGILTKALASRVSGTVTHDESRSLKGTGRELEEGEPCCVVYTADVSEHLVAHAGALCTRIIGVKRASKKANAKQRSLKGFAEPHHIAGSKGATSESHGYSKSTGEIIHYYIDDGCYGSLSSNASSKKRDQCSTGGTSSPTESVLVSQRFHPVPLYGKNASPREFLPSSMRKNTDETTAPAHQLRGEVDSTVWGPTCDGLDRVCESVSLPNDLQTNRDWLVFPHLGCGGFGGGLGLGTAFNGFDPPDTVYCVLGYFSGGSDGFGRKMSEK